jgi:hypothetical protein
MKAEVIENGLKITIDNTTLFISDVIIECLMESGRKIGSHIYLTDIISSLIINQSVYNKRQEVK